MKTADDLIKQIENRQTNLKEIIKTLFKFENDYAKWYYENTDFHWEEPPNKEERSIFLTNWINKNII
jgi:hypothetical protein